MSKSGMRTPRASGRAVGTVAQNLRRDVIIKAGGFVIGDDDGAVLPDVLVGGDRVDDACGHSLRELAVGIARMIVVAGLPRPDRGEPRRGRALLVGVFR